MSEQRIILKAPKTKKKIARSKDHGMYGMVRLTPEACDILEMRQNYERAKKVQEQCKMKGFLFCLKDKIKQN